MASLVSVGWHKLVTHFLSVGGHKLWQVLCHLYEKNLWQVSCLLDDKTWYLRLRLKTLINFRWRPEWNKRIHGELLVHNFPTNDSNASLLYHMLCKIISLGVIICERNTFLYYNKWSSKLQLTNIYHLAVQNILNTIWSFLVVHLSVKRLKLLSFTANNQ